MSLLKPTLLLQGNIISQKWMNVTEKRKIQNQISIDFIMDFITDRMPSRRGKKSKIRANNLGDKVILLKSGTGSGKSTNIPPKLYFAFFDKLFKNIAVTEPRKLTTETIPEDILEFQSELKMKINIGYQTKSINRSPIKGIIFMTVGILLKHFKLMSDEEIINTYMFIIIDEFHERTLDIDSLLFYIKRFLDRNYDNPNCPIIILMSATFEKKSYIEYFNIPEKHYIEVKGVNFPKKHIYETNNVNNLIERTIEIVKNIHMSEEGLKDIGEFSEQDSNRNKKINKYNLFLKENKQDTTICEKKVGCKNRDIIIFVPSMKQINEIINRLHMLNLDENFIIGGYISPIGINSYLYNKGDKEYQDLLRPIEDIITKLIKKSKKGGNQLEIKNWQNKEVNVTRRIIVATNVAETGITIPTLKYCIDTGFSISIEFNPIFGAELILNKNISQGASEQRAGRVGRKGPGVIYYLYTEKMKEMFIKDSYPEMMIKDFTNNLLSSIIEETETELDIINNTAEKQTLNNTSEEQTLNDIICTTGNINKKLFHNKPFNALDLDYLSYPSADSIQYSLEKLYILGLITQKGSTLAPYKKQNNGEIYPTLMGYFANNMRYMKIENKRMILAGYHYGCNIIDLITIATFVEKGWRNISTVKRKKYKPLNPLKLKKREEILLYNKLIFMDEFIECLWIWLLFMEFIDDLDKKGKVNILTINKWCEDNELNYEGLLNIIKDRDEIIEDLLSQNINIFYNGLNLKRGTYNLLEIIREDMEAGIEEIKKIKHCIFEGYKLNIATYNSVIRTYELDYKKIPLKLIDSPLIKSIPINNDEIKQSVPKKIIVSNYLIIPNNFESGLYTFASGDYISILDGFVTLDNGLISQYP